MPDNIFKSKVYENKDVLPGGGGSYPFIKPPMEAPKLASPQMQPQLGLKPVSQQMTEQITPILRSNYFAQPQPAATFPPTPPTPPITPTSTYTPSITDPTQSVMDFMLAPSKQEQELYKENESKKRLLLLTDALRHIGNIYNTTRGATPQQFNSPVVEQEQRYQQKRNELRAQRAAALKYQMDQAKLNADQAYKSSMLGMKQAELERGLANDEWNRQWNQFKWAGDQANKDREFDFKKANADRTFAETVRSNKANEGLRRESNSIAKMNAKTSRDRLNFEKGEGGGLSKGKIYLPHANMSMGGTTKWIIDEKTYKNAIPAIYNAMRKANLIQPLSNSQFYNDTGEERFAKMRQLVESQYTSDIYNDWMERLGATTNDGYKETTQDRVVRQSGGGIHPRKKSTK